MACQIPRSYHAAVKPSGLLYTGKGTNLTDNSVQSLWVGGMARDPPGVPESRAGPQGMFSDLGQQPFSSWCFCLILMFPPHHVPMCCFILSDCDPHCHHLPKPWTCSLSCSCCYHGLTEWGHHFYMILLLHGDTQGHTMGVWTAEQGPMLLQCSVLVILKFLIIFWVRESTCVTSPENVSKGFMWKLCIHSAIWF